MTTAYDARRRIEEVYSTLGCLTELREVRDTDLQYTIEGLQRSLGEAAEILSALEDAPAHPSIAAKADRVVANRIVRRKRRSRKQ